MALGELTFLPGKPQGQIKASTWGWPVTQYFRPSRAGKCTLERHHNTGYEACLLHGAKR